MNTSDVNLDSVAKVLIRCFWIAVAIQVVWFLGYLVGGDWAYGLHQGFWNGLTPHEFALFNLCALSLFKMGALGAFLVPYIAIRMVLSRSKVSDTR